MWHSAHAEHGLKSVQVRIWWLCSSHLYCCSNEWWTEVYIQITKHVTATTGQKTNSHASTHLDNQQFSCKHMTGQALTIHLALSE